MIGVPVDDSLTTACERRVGRRICVATILDVRRAACPAARTKARKRDSVAIALTDTDIWFLEYRYWIVGFTVGAVLTHWPRGALVAHWRRRPWAWPSVWRLELSWPERGFYIEGDMMGGADADLMIGLMTADELDRVATPLQSRR